MNLRLFRTSATLLAAVLAIVSGCGDDGGSVGPDAALPANARLVIPPGDTNDIGVAPNTTVSLRVLYETGLGEPIPDATVTFALESGPGGSLGGATLSAGRARTDALGIARIKLFLGADRATFRVTARAPNAPSLTFYINATHEGTTELVVTPVHEGPRDAALYERIEVRVFRPDTLVCADFDPEAPPPALFPPKSLAGFGGSVQFLSLNTGEPHTMVAWAELPGGARTAAGCVDISGPQLLATRAHTPVVVRDRPLALPDPVELRSDIDLGAVATALRNAGADASWRALACPAGPGQLLLDCALDAHADDGLLDCTVGGNAPLVASVEAARGQPDTDGCRPLTVDSSPSLDARLTDAISAGGLFPTGAELDALLSARRDCVEAVQIDSTLRPAPGALLRHRLDSATITVAGQAYEVALADSARPLISAELDFQLDFGPDLVLAPHSFTLEYGTIARAAFTDVGLDPAGLDPTTLGQALAASVTDGNQTGCPAFSAVVCDEVGEPATCLETACAGGATALDGELQDWWGQLDAAGLDLTLTGIAEVTDDDADLVVDDLSTGSWAATFLLADDTEAETVGAFLALPIE